MSAKKWRLDLQLFAEGGDGAGAAASGVTSADAGQESGVTAVDAEQRLRELGVPEDKLPSRRRKAAKHQTAAAEVQEPSPAAEAESTQQQEAEPEPEQGPARPTWDELMKDPEYNRQMQNVVRASVSRYKDADEKLSKLAPAIELIARQKGMDIEHLDYDALAKTITEDQSFYEQRAVELGVPVEQAMQIDKEERETARQRRVERQEQAQRQFQEHIQKLQAQGEELKKTFKSFDLTKELQNATFARLTAPGVGLSVEDAYYAIHRKEIQAAANQVIAKETARKLANSVRTGQNRPAENGTAGAAPSVTTFDYRSATKQQREALKQRIRNAAARGEKIYPGQE